MQPEFWQVWLCVTLERSEAEGGGGSVAVQTSDVTHVKDRSESTANGGQC